MAKKGTKKADYFGLGRVLSLILAIIPFTEPREGRYNDKKDSRGAYHEKEI